MLNRAGIIYLAVLPVQSQAGVTRFPSVFHNKTFLWSSGTLTFDLSRPSFRSRVITHVFLGGQLSAGGIRWACWLDWSSSFVFHVSILKMRRIPRHNLGFSKYSHILGHPWASSPRVWGPAIPLSVEVVRVWPVRLPLPSTVWFFSSVCTFVIISSIQLTSWGICQFRCGEIVFYTSPLRWCSCVPSTTISISGPLLVRATKLHLLLRYFWTRESSWKGRRKNLIVLHLSPVI